MLFNTRLAREQQWCSVHMDKVIHLRMRRKVNVSECAWHTQFTQQHAAIYLKPSVHSNSISAIIRYHEACLTQVSLVKLDGDGTTAMAQEVPLVILPCRLTLDNLEN